MELALGFILDLIDLITREYKSLSPFAIVCIETPSRIMIIRALTKSLKYGFSILFGDFQLFEIAFFINSTPKTVSERTFRSDTN